MHKQNSLFMVRNLLAVGPGMFFHSCRRSWWRYWFLMGSTTGSKGQLKNSSFMVWNWTENKYTWQGWPDQLQVKSRISTAGKSSAQSFAVLSSLQRTRWHCWTLTDLHLLHLQMQCSRPYNIFNSISIGQCHDTMWFKIQEPLRLSTNTQQWQDCCEVV